MLLEEEFSLKKHVSVKVISLVITLAMLLLLPTACGTTQGATSTAATTTAATTTAAATTAATTSAEPTTTEPAPVIDPMAKYDTPITITTVKRTVQGQKFENPTDTEEDNNWTRLMKEYGINIKYLWTADASQYENKCNLSIASGEIPDVIRMFDNQVNLLLEGDMVMDMKETIDKYSSPLVKEILSEDGGGSMKAGVYDGKQLFIPTHVQEGRNWFAPLWIRADWLKKVGLAEPKTYDEFLKVCDAFVNQDPDGNGQNDTYALGLAGKDNLITDWAACMDFSRCSMSSPASTTIPSCSTRRTAPGKSSGPEASCRK